MIKKTKEKGYNVRVDNYIKKMETIIKKRKGNANTKTTKTC